MENKLEMKTLRKSFSTIGWALLIYMLIMNMAAILEGIVQSFLAMIKLFAQGNLDPSTEQVKKMVQSMSGGMGWSYLLTILVGYVILRMWKGKAFCRKEIWKRGAPMDLGSFLCQFCVMVSAQLAFSLMYPLMEMVLNQFGMTAMPSVESATGNSTGLMIFLYVCILGPIAEELLFRGLVLRLLLPHGKRFAILLSALLFGVFHGNVVQIPYAFLAGLIFGYTTVEHSIAWAMVLHMFNNMVLSDMSTRLGTFIGEDTSSLLFGMLIMVCSIAAVVIAIVRRHDIWAYVHANKVDNRKVQAFFTSGGILTFLILTEVLVVAGLLLQLIPV